MNSINTTPGLHRRSRLDIQSMRHQAEQMGYTVFVLPEKDIKDRTSFFDAVRTTFPLDPPLLGSRSWDALSDSLWEGLRKHNNHKIVVIWKNTQQMSEEAFPELTIALKVLEDIAILLSDEAATCGRNKHVEVYVSP